MRVLLVEPLMDLAAAESCAAAPDLDAVRGFLPKRRQEVLSWRAMVRRELGADIYISYDITGTPAVAGAHISVAHSRDMVAVCISDRRCGVDIEPESRDCSRAAVRYMSPDERQLSDSVLLPVVVWCAKEAMYKFAGREGVDFLRDICITEVDFAAGTVRGRYNFSVGAGSHAAATEATNTVEACEVSELELKLERRDGFIVVYIM